MFASSIRLKRDALGVPAGVFAELLGMAGPKLSALEVGLLANAEAGAADRRRIEALLSRLETVLAANPFVCRHDARILRLALSALAVDDLQKQD